MYTLVEGDCSKQSNKNKAAAARLEGSRLGHMADPASFVEGPLFVDQ